MASAVIKRLIVHSERRCLDSIDFNANDNELLQEFLQGEPGESEAAFRSLVVRHGPMVMGVCKQVLNQDEDAEDAFQATFLTLAQRAETIRDRRLLSAWLYEVAYRIAIRARYNAARRRDQEKRGAALASPIAFPQHEDEAAWAELRPVLHDELNRLPDKYRLPIILSYLEGRTNEEVARLLRWPVGTVKGRLSRARDLLRSRLLRRGLALSAAFLCSSLSHGVVFAEIVTDSLVDHTVHTVLGCRSVKCNSPVSSGDDFSQTVVEGPPAPSRAEELSRLIDGKGQNPLHSWLMHGLAALIILLMLATAFIFTDQTLTYRFKQSALSLIHSGMRSACHDR